jgi:hypothetical protein
VIEDRWPLKLTITVAIFESQSRMLPSSYPTAKMSLSVGLWTIAVTCALQLLSFHRPSSSPFLRSQHKTSSFAGAMALPPPMFREVSASADQITFAVPELMRPKVFECSYFLREYISIRALLGNYKKTYKYDLTIFYTWAQNTAVSNIFFEAINFAISGAYRRTPQKRLVRFITPRRLDVSLQPAIAL